MEIFSVHFRRKVIFMNAHAMHAADFSTFALCTPSFRCRLIAARHLPLYMVPKPVSLSKKRTELRYAAIILRVDISIKMYCGKCHLALLMRYRHAGLIIYIPVCVTCRWCSNTTASTVPTWPYRPFSLSTHRDSLQVILPHHSGRST